MTHSMQLTGLGEQLKAAISAGALSEDEARELTEKFRRSWPVLTEWTEEIQRRAPIVMGAPRYQRLSSVSSAFMLHLVAGEQRRVQALSFMGDRIMLSTPLELLVPRPPPPQRDIWAWAGFFYNDNARAHAQQE